MVFATGAFKFWVRCKRFFAYGFARRYIFKTILNAAKIAVGLRPAPRFCGIAPYFQQIRLCVAGKLVFLHRLTHVLRVCFAQDFRHGEGRKLAALCCLNAR